MTMAVRLWVLESKPRYKEAWAKEDLAGKRDGGGESVQADWGSKPAREPHAHAAADEPRRPHGRGKRADEVLLVEHVLHGEEPSKFRPNAREAVNDTTV